MKRKEIAEQAWQQATLADDYVFNKVMLDKAIVTETLRRVLPELMIKTVKYVTSQQELTNSHDAKGVRLDIYVVDDQNNRYDVEMQVIDHHNLPQRVRYYQSSLAIDSYEKGENYREADNAYVIFFCCFDPFGAGLQQYIVERRFREKVGCPYNDGELTYFLNVASLRKEVNPKLQRVLDLIAERKVEGEDPFIVKLRQRIVYVKHNRKWRDEYMRKTLAEMDYDYGLKQAKKQGIEQGMQRGAADNQKAIVHKLIQSGQTHDQVITFLEQIIGMEPGQAEDYYQKLAN